MLWHGKLSQNSVSVFLHVRDGTVPLRRCACWAELRVLRAHATRDEINDARETGRWTDLFSAIADRPSTEHFTLPLGQLATDHVGYCSFDLAPAREALRHMEEGQPSPTEFLACFVTGIPISVDHEYLTIDLLQDNSLRITPEAFTARLKLPIEKFVPQIEDHGMPAIQNPQLSDWRLSPASFASSAEALIGRDGCEHIMPANLAVQSFRYCQIVRLASEPWELDESHGEISNDGTKLRLGLAYEFRTDWFQLGHSLGQILYSLPLAPCETVKLAVIDWSRREDARRTDQQKMTEEIQHEQNRDRTITENVKATLREYQSGSSEMFGLALAASGAFKAFNAGGVLSLGAGAARSRGTRETAAEATQKLSDVIRQTSSAQREFQGTVVVQSNVTEREAIETRSFSNHNHCHTMTVLYYEVLRHLRIATVCERVRPVIFINRIPADFSVPREVIKHRYLLERGLIDERLLPCFGAVEKLICLGAEREALDKAGPRNLSFFQFHMEWMTGINEETTGQLWFSVILKENDKEVKLLRTQGAGTDPGQHYGEPFTRPSGKYADSYLKPEAGHVSYSSIKAVRLKFYGWDIRRGDRPIGGDWILGALRLHGTHSLGEHLIFDGLLNQQMGVGWGSPPGETNADFDTFDIPVWSPAAGQLLPDQSIDVSPLDLPEPDRCCYHRLREHLVHYQDYYNRYLWLNEDAAARAVLFDAIYVPGETGVTLLDLIENRPLDTLGTAVAYPLAPFYFATVFDKLSIEPDLEFDTRPLEQLITVPTRGVFAEAKLGHCNGCEEIDDTRFWNWQESPCPDEAPNIADIEAGKHQPAAGAEQGTMPGNVLNIVNPPAAPDPHGLGEALKLLGTANLFRDMSMQSQLGDLLKSLGANATALAGGKTPGADKNTSNAGADTGKTGGTSGMGAPPKPALDDARSTQNKGKVADRLGLSPEDNAKVKKALAQDMSGADLMQSKTRFLVFDAYWDKAQRMVADFSVQVETLVPGGTVDFPYGPFSTSSSFVAEVSSDLLLQNVTVFADNALRPDTAFSLEVPSFTVDGLSFQKSTIKLPRRTEVMHVPLRLSGHQNNIGFPKDEPVLRFHVRGELGVDTIKIKLALNATTEIAAELGRELEQKLNIGALLGAAGGTTGSAAAAAGAATGGATSAGAGAPLGETALKFLFKGAAKVTGGAAGEVEFSIDIIYVKGDGMTVDQVNLPKPAAGENT